MNNRLVFLATAELGDWFSLLGGANRYRGMRESDIFLYIACKILDDHRMTNLVGEFIYPEFITCGKNAIHKANKHLAALSLKNESELKAFIAEYTSFYDEKLKKTDDYSAQWTDFLKKFNANEI